MSNLEQKILDGPQIHYCDAENNDLRLEEEDDENSDSGVQTHDASSLFVRPDEETSRLERVSHVKWKTGSTNTGPKGVIEDFKKRSLSKDKSIQSDSVDDLEAEFQGLLNDDSILKDYISKRIAEAVQSNKPTFGHMYRLRTGPELLDAIDKENPNVLVLVHIYTKFSRPCANLNRCLDKLAQELKHIKFVNLDASVTALSANFKENGVPALLAYRGGNLVKSIVQLEELLDKDFDTAEIKELLTDQGLIV